MTHENQCETNVLRFRNTFVTLVKNVITFVTRVRNVIYDECGLTRPRVYICLYCEDSDSTLKIGKVMREFQGDSPVVDSLLVEKHCSGVCSVYFVA